MLNRPRYLLIDHPRYLLIDHSRYLLVESELAVDLTSACAHTAQTQHVTLNPVVTLTGTQAGR